MAYLFSQNNTIFISFAAYLGAKIQKKVVTGNGFWKINAIRPKILLSDELAQPWYAATPIAALGP